MNNDIEEIRQHYRNTFDTPSGRIVFHDILSRGGFFSANLANEDIGRHSLVMEIIEIISAFSNNPHAVSMAIADALIKQPLATEPQR